MVLVAWGASVVSTYTTLGRSHPLQVAACVVQVVSKSGTNVHVLCGGTQEFESLVVHKSSLNSQ